MGKGILFSYEIIIIGDAPLSSRSFIRSSSRLLSMANSITEYFNNPTSVLYYKQLIFGNLTSLIFGLCVSLLSFVY